MTDQTSDLLLCFLFDAPLTVQQVVLDLQSSGGSAAELASEAIVGIWEADGDIRLTQTTEIESRPIIWPGAWPALLVGTIYAASIAGGMWGVSLAGLWSRLIEVGLDRDSMQRLAEALQPGGSAAFFLIRAGEEDVITAALKGRSVAPYRLAVPKRAIKELSSRLARIDPRRLPS